MSNETSELQAHQHRMDWADTLADLIRERDENEDGYVDVLSVERRTLVDVMLGIGGPTRYVRFHVYDGEPYRAEYVDTWAVPDEVSLSDGEMWDAWELFGGELLLNKG